MMTPAIRENMEFVLLVAGCETLAASPMVHAPEAPRMVTVNTPWRRFHDVDHTTQNSHGS